MVFWLHDRMSNKIISSIKTLHQKTKTMKKVEQKYKFKEKKNPLYLKAPFSLKKEKKM